MQLTAAKAERFENHSKLSRFEPDWPLRFVTAAEQQLALVTDDRFHGSSFLLVLVIGLTAAIGCDIRADYRCPENVRRSARASAKF